MGCRYTIRKCEHTIKDWSISEADGLCPLCLTERVLELRRAITWALRQPLAGMGIFSEREFKNGLKRRAKGGK